jgi:hypothetical protein
VVLATSMLPPWLLPADGAGTDAGLLAAAGPERAWVAPWSIGASSDVVAALWPVVLGVVVAALVVVATRRRRRPAWAARWNDHIPPGDVVVLGEAGWSRARGAARALGQRADRARSRTGHTLRGAGRALQTGRLLDSLDDVGTRWRTAGIGLGLVVAITTLALMS